jgi:hypothetical protein
MTKSRERFADEPWISDAARKLECLLAKECRPHPWLLVAIDRVRKHAERFNDESSVGLSISGAKRSAESSS